MSVAWVALSDFSLGNVFTLTSILSLKGEEVRVLDEALQQFPHRRRLGVDRVAHEHPVEADGGEPAPFAPRHALRSPSLSPSLSLL